MSTTSREQTISTAKGGAGSGDSIGAGSRQAGMSDQLYRVIWRWHFYAGIAQQKMPGNNLTVWFPRIPNGVYLVTANNNRGPQVNERLFIDRASGEILDDRDSSQTKLVYQVGTWNYPLHVGSIGRLPTKILWLATCVVVATAPVTGIWMWWQRRPTGGLGLPSRVNAARPRWLVGCVTAISVLLPALGLSVVVLVAGEKVVGRWRKR